MSISMVDPHGLWMVLGVQQMYLWVKTVLNASNLQGIPYVYAPNAKNIMS